MNIEQYSYYDFKNSQTSIFEAEEVEGATFKEIYEAKKLYNNVLDKILNDKTLNESEDEDEKYNIILEKLNNGGYIDEGLLGGIVGGAAGALAGPAIGKAICKALGIDEKGHLGKLLTSRLVTTAVAAKLGYG